MIKNLSPIIIKVINLKKTTKLSLCLFAVCLLCCAALVGGGYLYLKFSFKETDNSVSKVPYEFAKPENSGIMLDFCGDKTFLYLDFEDSKLSVIMPPENSYTDKIYGYNIDYSVSGDYYLLADIIDAADGIELTVENVKTRFTGAQIAVLLSETVETDELKRRIAAALIQKISENGIDENVFTVIIKKAKTNLTVPDCFRWSAYIKELCKNGTIIN